MARPSPAEAVRAASLAVLTWVDHRGAPHAAGVMPLTRADTPVVAFTFDRAGLALSLAGHGDRARKGPVVLVLAESRGTATGFRPCLLRSTPVLDVDLTGEDYAASLREEELRRYPPARLLADSLILCREHWWYLPRLVLSLPTPEMVPLDADDADGATRSPVLVTVGEGGPRATLVRPSRADLRTTSLALDVVGGDRPVPGGAVLFDQDASFPDLERWSDWSWHGRMEERGDDAALVVDHSPSSVGLPPARPLLERWRSHRRLERACRRALDRWEREQPLRSP